MLTPLSTPTTTLIDQAPIDPGTNTLAPPLLIKPDVKATSQDLISSPASRGGQKVGISALNLAVPDSKKPSALALIPGSYPDAVSLPDVLKQIGTSPQGQAAVKGLLANLQAQTGIAIPQAMVNVILNKPERLVDVLVARPDQLSQGIDAINLAHKSGKLKDLPPKARLLPDTFDFAKMASATHAKPAMEPKLLTPGLWQGDIASDISPEKAKSNMVTAEALDRLADNADLKPADQFRVKYGDKTYSRLDSFLKALVADGHTIEARVEHRVANFADLKTKGPDGAWLDVPAALMVKTGVFKGEQEALVPTVHSELIFSIKKGPNTKGPGIDADVKWYQGISGTGFFPCDLAKSPSWCGKAVADTFTGEKALEAAQLAGQFSDVINAAASTLKLAVGGYGATGVCNDSVAVIQQLMAGRTTAYPLLMRDETLAPELEKRKHDANQGDAAGYKRLAGSVLLVPSDAVANDSSKARALASIPWVAGKEPFQSVITAKEILAAN